MKLNNEGDKEIVVIISVDIITINECLMPSRTNPDI